MFTFSCSIYSFSKIWFVFVMAGGFYNGRCIYVPSSFISVLLSDGILELVMPNNFIGYKVRKIVCWYKPNYCTLYVKFDIIYIIRYRMLYYFELYLKKILFDADKYDIKSYLCNRNFQQNIFDMRLGTICTAIKLCFILKILKL